MMKNYYQLGKSISKFNDGKHNSIRTAVPSAFIDDNQVFENTSSNSIVTVECGKNQLCRLF